MANRNLIHSINIDDLEADLDLDNVFDTEIAKWIGTDQTVDPDTGQGSDAVLQGREPSTGALLRTIALGGDIRDVESGFGSLWVYDNDANTIKRVDL